MRKDPKNIALPRIDATPEQIAGALLAFVQPPVQENQEPSEETQEDQESGDAGDQDEADD